MLDRFTVASLAVMYAFIPLYGSFAVFAPHPPTAPLLARPLVVAIAAVLVLAMAGVALGAIRRRQPQAMHAAMLVNVAATYVGAFFGFDPIVGVFLIATGVAGCVATHFAAIAYYRDANVARTIYLALLLSGACASLLAIALVVFKHPADLYAFNHGRAVGTFLNPNELAAYLLAYLGVSCGIAMVRRATLIGNVAAVCSALGIIALTLTFSRMAVVAAFCGLAVYMLIIRPRRGLVATLAVFVLAAGVNVALSTRHHDPQDTGIRGVAWRAGLTTFAHFPLTGVGPLAFERLYPVMRAPDAPGSETPVAFDPHSLPLSIAAETGVFGLGAFLLGFWVFGRAFYRAFSAATEERRIFATAVLAGIIALLVHSLINSVSVAFPLLAQFTALALAAAYWGFEPNEA